MRPSQAPFPASRLRRTRQSPAIRALVRDALGEVTPQ